MKKSRSHFHIKFSLLVAILLSVAFSCSDEKVTAPKPHAYPRIEFPERHYEKFQREECPFTFQMPQYAEVIRQKDSFGDEPGNPCWFDLHIPIFDGNIHFSYYPITAENPLSGLINDAFRMAFEHNRKANYIEEIPVEAPVRDVHGMVFQMRGPVASSLQFYLTDSTDHFVRGALYFNTTIDVDSLAPVQEFVQEDIRLMIKSFQWLDTAD